MNEIKSFTFYDNYYKLLKLTKTKEDKKELSVCIVEYMFEDIEPINLSEENQWIWDNIVMPLNTSKKQAKNVNKRWSINDENNTNSDTKRDTKRDTTDNTKEHTKRDTNNISSFLFLISNFIFLKDRGLLRGKIEEWLKYKWEKKEYYKETGFKTLLTRIEKYTNKFGEDKVIDLIDDCMANCYKGIVFTKLEEQQNKTIYKSSKDKWEETKRKFLEGED